MAAAASYDQWKEIAESLYKMEETDLPATDASIQKEAQLYDRKLLQNKTSHMKRIGQLGNAQEIMFAMRIDLTRNIANIAKRCVHFKIYAQVTGFPCVFCEGQESCTIHCSHKLIGNVVWRCECQ